jgi:tellurite resistance protein TehA-like permease
MLTDDTLPIIAIALLGALTIGLLPTWIAFRRDCKSRWGIFVINFFLGVTGIGWVVALAWAACGEKKS